MKGSFYSYFNYCLFIFFISLLIPLFLGYRKKKLRSYEPREALSNISEQGTASVADRNQVSYDGFDIFSDALGPLEESEMGLYPTLGKKDKNKKKQVESMSGS